MGGEELVQILKTESSSHGSCLSCLSLTNSNNIHKRVWVVKEGKYLCEV